MKNDKARIGLRTLLSAQNPIFALLLV